MYFKLDESLAHSSLNFLLELAMQLRKYIWILRVIEWMKCMSYLTDKFVLGLTLFTQIIVSFLVDKMQQYFIHMCSVHYYHAQFLVIFTEHLCIH